jgi:hypothetical protein
MLKGPHIVALVGLLLAALVAGWTLGWRGALHEMAGDKSSAYTLRQDKAQLQTRVAELEGEAEMLRTRYAVSQRALELVRAEFAAHKGEVAELEEELRFFRGLMAPESAPSGVDLQVPEVVRGEDEGQFQVRLVVRQAASKHQRLHGSLAVAVAGQLQGEEAILALSELSENYSEDELPLEFRYFQALELTLQLPTGFEPAALVVKTRITKPQAVEVDQEFSWQVQERFDYVGQ